MRPISGGTFRMGADQSYSEEALVHAVVVNGFWMDEHTVTNAEFGAFVAARVVGSGAVRDLAVRGFPPPQAKSQYLGSYRRVPMKCTPILDSLTPEPLLPVPRAV